VQTAGHHTVLTFHGVGEPGTHIGSGERAVWVSYRDFVPVLDAISTCERVRITFDDGNVSDLQIALPALLEHGLVAEFFVPTGRLGSRGYLGEAGVRELADSGMEVGSHGVRHVSWRNLSDAALRAELEDSRMRLEDILGHEVAHAACPLGEYDRRVLRALRRAGYRRVYTSDGGSTRSDAWMQNRNTIPQRCLPEDIGRICTPRPRSPTEILRRAKIMIKRLR
jgi:peptidoglycan/xylan/chitin deacetylase (PgdA/CDA1 family)